MAYHIADAHCDRLSSHSQTPDITPERLRDGNVSLQCFALFASIHNGDPYVKARSQLEVFKELCGNGGKWPVRQTKRAHLPHDHTAALLTIEGGEILEGSMSRFDEFYEEGVRAVALTWNHENEIGFPARIDGEGLKPFGKTLVREMEARGVAADVSHLSEKGFWDVEKLCGPFMASHSNAKALCGHFRNLTDEQIKAVIDHGGFIGVNFYSVFLRDDDKAADISDVVRHILYIIELGGERTVGFGSDFDGIECKPLGLEHAGDFGKLMEALGEQGLADQTLRAIAGENFISFMERIGKIA